MSDGMLRLALVALFATASVAQAAPPGSMPLPARSAPVEAGPSRGVAVLLSTGTTLAGLWMVTSAEHHATALLGAAVMTVGPTTGRWYAGEASFAGIGLRSLAALSMFAGLSSFHTECDGDCNSEDALAGTLLIGGGALWISSAFVDVVLADRAARDYNARRLFVAPLRSQTPSGVTTGLALTGRF